MIGTECSQVFGSNRQSIQITLHQLIQSNKFRIHYEEIVPHMEGEINEVFSLCKQKKYL